MKPTLANLKKLAASMGATVEIEVFKNFGITYRRVFVDLNIVGKHFAHADTMLDDVTGDGPDGPVTIQDVYANLIEQLQAGLRDCPFGPCNECDRD